MRGSGDESDQALAQAKQDGTFVQFQSPCGEVVMKVEDGEVPTAGQLMVSVPLRGSGDERLYREEMTGSVVTFQSPCGEVGMKDEY